MPQFTVDEKFIDLYSFVVDMGGDESHFLHDLKAFHQHFVNAHKRRLRLDAFSMAIAFPLDRPHLKVASLKYLYVEGRYDRGFCNPVSVKHVIEKPQGQAASAVAEDILRFFHVECGPALKSLRTHTRIRFLGNIDKDIFGKLIVADHPAAPDLGIRACGARYYKRLVKMVPPGPVPAFTLGPLSPVTPAVAEGQPDMQPRIIQYDAAGQPLTRQDATSSTGRPEVYGWFAFLETSTMTDAIQEIYMKSAILSHLSMLHRQMPPVTDEHLTIEKGGVRGGGVHVLAAKDLAVGALRMAPVVVGDASLSRVSPRKPAVFARDHGDSLGAQVNEVLGRRWESS